MTSCGADLCGGPYSVIYADPPWPYRDKQANRPANYHRMTLRDLHEMPVEKLGAENSALFLWATMPLLPDALKLMEAWGYPYKTNAFTWVKITGDGRPAMGMGYYTRSNAELCLLGVRGKLERRSKAVRSVIMSQRREHSQKPDEVLAGIEDLYGDVPRIELFRRGAAIPGWCSFGDEANHSCVTLDVGEPCYG